MGSVQNTPVSEPPTGHGTPGKPTQLDGASHRGFNFQFSVLTDAVERDGDTGVDINVNLG